MIKYFEQKNENGTIVISDDKEIYNLKSCSKLSSYFSFPVGYVVGDAQIYHTKPELQRLFKIPIENSEDIVALYVKESARSGTYSSPCFRMYNYYDISYDEATGRITVHNEAAVNNAYVEVRNIQTNNPGEPIHNEEINYDDVIVYIFSKGVFYKNSYGLEIINENGRTLFHSSNYVMDVKDCASLQEPATNWSAGHNVHDGWSYDCGEKAIAFSMGSIATLTHLDIWPTSVYCQLKPFCVCFNLSNIKIMEMKYKQQVPDELVGCGSPLIMFFVGRDFMVSNTSQLLIIDVTNAPVPP